MGFEIKNTSGDSLFGLDFTQKNFEEKGFQAVPMDLSLPFGHVKAMQWLFDGIRMSFTESIFNDPVTLDWKGDTEMITMNFNLQGRISIIDKSMPRAFELSANQHNIFYGKEAEGQLKAGDKRMTSFLIQLSKKTFLNIASDGNDALKRFSDNVACGRSIAFSDTNLSIDLSLQNCINAILNCNYSNSLKRIYFFSKSIELLVLQAEAFDRLGNNKKRYIKNSYDKERILHARDYLLQHMENPPALNELSRIAGINEYKLKKGFKEIFNRTVFEYLAENRLEMARKHLLDRSKPITEIAFELGYSSVQHFSAAFRKKFGVSPRKIM